MPKGYVLAPYKQFAERGVKQQCEICNSKFKALMKQEHQCKRCLRAVCEACSLMRQKVFKPDGSVELHRSCIICKKQHDNLTKLISSNHLCFGNQSQFADKWKKKLNKQKLSDQAIMEQYYEQERFTNQSTIKFKSQSDRIFTQLPESYNYSLRLFMGLMTEMIDKDKARRQLYTRKKIQRVLHAVYAYLKDLPYISELVYLVAFLLCFSNEHYCYFIITRLIGKVYPQYLKIYKMNRDNILLSTQLKVLVEMYVSLASNEKMNASQQQLNALGQFLQYRFTSLIKCFTLNLCSAYNSFYIIDQTLKNGNSVELYKGFIALVFNCRQLLQEDRSPEEIELFMLRDVTHEGLKTTMISFEKINKKIEAEHQFFDSAEHRKLHEKYQQMESLYAKSEENLKAKDALLQSIIKDYEIAKGKILNMNSRITQLEEEVLKYSEIVPKLQDFQRMNDLNKILLKKNEMRDEENKRLKKAIQQIERDRAVKEGLFNVYSKLEKEYLQELTRLKTENEIYEIERKAKQIDFNTSVIEEKISVKNAMIVDLQERNRSLQAQVEYYRKKSEEERYFNSSLSMINSRGNLNLNSNLNSNTTARKENQALTFSSMMIPSISLSTQQEKDNFKKHMEIAKELIDKLKGEKAEMQQTIQKQEKHLAFLKEKTDNQQKRLEIKDEIDYFINQIPEEESYAAALHELQRLITKETSIIKKSVLESVLSAYKNCLHEARYRTIDSKLKENKIKQIQNKEEFKGLVQSLLASMVEKNVPSQPSLDELADKMEQLDDIGKLQKSVLKKQQCSIM